jgi:hypothetical protein
MQTTTSLWPLTYRGVGITMETLPDGTHQGVTEDGFRSAPFADITEALAEATAHIDRQKGTK